MPRCVGVVLSEHVLGDVRVARHRLRRRAVVVDGLSRNRVPVGVGGRDRQQVAESLVATVSPEEIALDVGDAGP